MEDKCQFCMSKRSSPFYLEFRCGTKGTPHLGQTTWSRSDDCYERQLAAQAEEIAGLKALVREMGQEMSHARIFIDSREKMHSDGIKLYDGILNRPQVQKLMEGE